MRRLLAFIGVLVLVNVGKGQVYMPVDQGSEIEFKAKNFGINVRGHLEGLKGEIIFFGDNPANSHFEVTVDVNTVNTGINQRNNHLKSDNFLDVAKYPQIHFLSTRVTKSTSKEYLYLFGKLTIKDVTKEISFPFKVTPRDGGLFFEGEFSLDRRDYNVGGSSLTMSDNVKVSLKVLAKMKE